MLLRSTTVRSKKQFYLFLLFLLFTQALISRLLTGLTDFGVLYPVAGTRKKFAVQLFICVSYCFLPFANH